MNKPNQDRDELTWLAFQYVAGDFSAAAAEQFEERLATDQAAREAVAEAVELLHAVCAAEASEPVVAVAAHQSIWSQKLVWISTGAAAAVALVAGVLSINPWGGFSPSRPERNVAAVSPALVDAWSAIRKEAADESASHSVSASAVLTEAELALAEEDLALSTEAPSWMTAGVLGLSGKDLETSESQPQEN
jgi:hypothetical protein